MFGKNIFWTMGRTQYLITLVLMTTFLGISKGDSEFNIIGLNGEAVELPCNVDVKVCGEVYFITWTKFVVSNEWKRIYLYSDSVEKPLQELANPDRADFFIKDSSAILKIYPIKVTDEGVYKCDVTYLNGKCPSLSFATLQIHAKPQRPEILFRGAEVADGAVVGPFIEGTQMELKCQSEGGKPRPEIGWWRGDDQLPAQMSEDTNENRVTSTLSLELSREDLGDKLTCKVVNDAIDKPLETSVEIDLQVRPKSLEIEAISGPYIAGRPVFFSCTVSGAKPAANVSWFNRSEALASQAKTHHTLLTDGTYQTESELELVFSSYDHLGKLYCKGTNPVLKSQGEDPLLKSIDLHILYPPNSLIEPSGGIIVNESEDATIFCSYEANPPNMTDVDWFRGEGRINVPTENKYEIIPGQDSPTLLIRNISREERGMYSCGVSNRFGMGNSSNSLEISVLFSPKVQAMISPRTINEGDESRVSLFCDIIEGNPQNLVKVRWYRENELLHETTEREIVWLGITRNFTGNYSCEGKNAAGWGQRSELAELIVNYLPGQARVVSLDSQVVKGELTTLVCDPEEEGRPPAEDYRWELNERLLEETSHKLIVGPADLETQGNYSCSAVNTVGTGQEGTYIMEVFAPPEFIDDLPDSTGVEKDSSAVSLFCTIECEPQCDVEWLRDGDPLDMDYYHIDELYLPQDLEKHHFRSVLSTLHWNVTAWPGNQFERERDNANYSCVSSANGVGDSVSSTTVFAVEFAPEDIAVTADHVDVLEGEIADPVVCSATSWPPSDYLWILNDRIVSDEATLYLNNSLSKERTGTYVCQASNKHGRASAEMFFNVLYKPTCEIKEDSSDEDAESEIICTVLHANPREVNFTWTQLNASETVKSEEWTSVLTIPPSERRGTYTCVVSNLAGTSDPCEVEVMAYLGLAGKIPETADTKMFIIASVIGGIAILFVLIIIIMIFIMRRKRSQDTPRGTKSDPLYQNMESGVSNGHSNEEPDGKAMYENMPFHRKTGPYRPDANDEMLYADVYDDVKTGKVPDPRMKPPLPPKGIGKKPKEPPLPPKTKKKGETDEILGLTSK